MNDPPLLEVSGLVKSYPAAAGFLRRTRFLHAVSGVDLDLRRGETLALVGESGSGKTTLARCVLGLTAPTAGTIRFAGQDTATLNGRARAALRRRMQPVFQDPFSSLDPRWTVGRSVREPLDRYRVGTPGQRDGRVRQLLEQVGLSGSYVGKYPAELSGGQRQRVGIATALALDPQLLVADEPVSALDVSVQAQILNLLARLQADLHLAVLFVSHDLSVVEHVSDRVAVMYLGRIVELGTTKAVFDHPRHPYTRALLEAIPHPDPTRRPEAAGLRGDIPSPLDPPSGCHLHPRCPLAIGICAAFDPPLYQFDSGQSAACHVTAADHGHRVPQLSASV